jgi:hypothetical protein
MKKIAFCLMITCLSLSIYPNQITANNSSRTSSLAERHCKEAAEAKTLLLRLNEINSMEKSNLKPTEKKQLRKEVGSIRHKLSDIGGGVYISAGGLILILILLIILL